MPNNYEAAFTHSHTLSTDGAVAFACSTDACKWPWRNLPPWHPIVVQTINYWASVETGKTRGTFDPTKWSALTYSKWESWPGTGPVAHGLADTPPGIVDEDKPGFRLTFFDSAGALVCRLIGTGVIFQSRDFEAWRSDAKEQVDIGHSFKDFAYAPASALGVTTDLERFVAAPAGTTRITSEALITKENGLMPHHPYHSGSGDHVNANHLVDAGFQFAHLIKGKPLVCTGGEIKFRHYVELGKPFTIELTAETGNSIEMRMHQSEKTCTDFTIICSD